MEFSKEHVYEVERKFVCVVAICVRERSREKESKRKRRRERSFVNDRHQ